MEGRKAFKAVGLLALLLTFLLAFPAFAAYVYVPAVSPDGKGTLAVLECRVVNGTGKVYVATDPLVGFDTQISERKAVEYIKKHYDFDLSNKDIFFLFHLNNTESVDGQSAGASMAICLLAELTHKPINHAVCMTGTVDENGKIGPVGGLAAKLKAASAKCSTFLVPKGQGVVITYQTKYYSPYPGVYIEETYPVKVNLTELGEKLGVKVHEVATVEEAAKYFFNMSIPPKEEMPKTVEREIIQQNITKSQYSPYNFTRLSKLVEYEIKRAEAALSTANNSVAKYYLSLAYSAPSWSPYTRANYAFLAVTSAVPVPEATAKQVINDLYKKFIENRKVSDPFWHAEAELRLSWAMFSKESASTRLEWALIASKMLSMEKHTGNVVPEAYIKGKADKAIKEAKDLIGMGKAIGVSCKDAEKSLEYAVKSYEKGLYYAAYYNALDAIAWAKACNDYSSNNIQQLLNLTGITYEHEFPEAYKRHALYLADQGNYEAALYLAYRAFEHDNAFKDIAMVPVELYNMKDLLLLSIAAIVLVSVVAYYKKRVKRRRKISLDLDIKDEIAWVEIKAQVIKKLLRMVDEGKMSREGARKIIELLEEIA